MKQGDDDWHRTRNNCAVTASRVGDAVGVGYSSRQKYWREKKGLEPKTEMNWRMQEGIRREPWVAELYFRLMGAFGAPVSLYTNAFTHLPEDHRMGGSVDRIVECDRTGERWVLEIKTCPDGAMRTELPVTHNLQMLFLCRTLQMRKAHYIAHSQCQGIFLAEVTWDESLWEKLIFPRLQSFAACVYSNDPPDKLEKGEKQNLIERIKAATHVREIECFTATELLRQPQQMLQDTIN